MTVSIVGLFFLSLIFSGFNFYLNAHISSGRWLQILTILFGLFGLVIAFSCIVALLINF